MPEMPDAKTSKSKHLSDHLPLIGLNAKPPELSEPQEVHLLIVEDDDGYREFPLGGEVYSLGRGEESDIRLVSLFVSRRHATLVRQPRDDGKYEYKIVDGNLKGQLSANGILINGQKLPVHILKNDDKVEFGPGVIAQYRLRYKERKSGPLDPYDITLIDPSRVDEVD
jgi:pSer/pThr/pTyr-binding forkhead associated (FHA) protein